MDIFSDIKQHNVAKCETHYMQFQLNNLFINPIKFFFLFLIFCFGFIFVVHFEDEDCLWHINNLRYHRKRHFWSEKERVCVWESLCTVCNVLDTLNYYHLFLLFCHIEKKESKRFFVEWCSELKDMEPNSNTKYWKICLKNAFVRLL